MEISSQSPIQSTTGTIYTNNPTQENKLFLEDTNLTTFYYAIIRKEGSRYKFIQNGQMYGFYDGMSYLYKMDFGNFIRYSKFNTSTIIKSSQYKSYFSGQRRCDLTFAISSSNIITSNSSKVVTEANGDVYMSGSYTPSDLTATKYRYEFVDGISSKGYIKPDIIYRGTTYPILLNSGVMFYSLFDLNNNLLESSSFSLPDGSDYVVGLINIPNNCRSIQFYYGADLPEIYAINNCGYPYYYLGLDGGFNLLYTTGVKNVIDNVKKDTIKIGNNIIVTKQITNKQIKQNSGLALNEDTIRSLIQSPFVYTITNDGSGNLTIKEYSIDNSTFDGYNGVSLGSRNIELIFNDPKEYKRITNKTIGFFD